MNYTLAFILILFFQLTFNPTLFAAKDIFEQVDPSINQVFSGDFEETKWQEDNILLVKLPDEDDLITFSGVAAYPQYKYAIDGKTLSIGKDEVIRFSIVISSSQGGKNSYFQGISCNNSNIKSYAYASSSSKDFISYQTPQWKKLSNSGSMGYSQNLADFYFCDKLGIVLKKNQILSNLKYGNSEARNSDDAY